MIDTSAFAAFLIASLVLLVTPGPAVLYIIGRSIDRGRSAGIASVFGVALGSMVHVVGAALGLSALLLESALAYSVVKYLGAAYLVYLGIRRLRGRDAEPAGARGERSLRRIFTQGIWVNALNPKTALFFLAFLPQFVDVDRGGVVLQFLMLGAIFVAMGLVTDGCYALAAGTFGNWLWHRPAVVRAQRLVTGGIFVTLGVATALSGSKD
jgi:threonine/homoserine/homoserine lactone efflux protein